jgi:uncharacterized RDD family membrane protein YckC
MNRNGSLQERSRAGFVSRTAADLIDAVVVCLGVVIIVMTASMFRALFAERAFALPKLPGVATASWISVVFFGYLTFFWTTTGRTPGKQASGLRVVTSRGQRLGLARAAARALVCIVFPIGLLWVLVSTRNRGLHDVLLGTAVVYDWHVHVDLHKRANARARAARQPADV